MSLSSKSITSSRRANENWVYLGLWIITICVYLLDAMQHNAKSGFPMVNRELWIRMLFTFTPYVILFLVSNYILIPRLLLRNHNKQYIIWTAASVICTFMCLVLSFRWHQQLFETPHHLHTGDIHHRPHPDRLVPLPLALDFAYTLLVVGINMAVALIFQRYEYRFERESLMKANAENQLSYLKMQINPHFYMNMLNNIHGMIEINPEKAQHMVIEMSELMRYMLYDSSRQTIPLSSEIAFLDNYIRLMRQRYPRKRVKILTSFPDEREAAGVNVAPLLFLVFVENAFKHGISYRSESFIEIEVRVEPDWIQFICINSVHPSETDNKKPGIGLENVQQRLRLLYGDSATLNIDRTQRVYHVSLTIPLYNS